MPTRQRYHIHVCLVRNEHPEFENALQLALSDDYFLTWDLIAHPNTFIEYSRQQIDRCDYLLFVLGNSYGHISLSGVSLLHLSYIYAATKRKPMIALIKTQTGNVTFTRQRLDLANLMQKDQGERVIYFHRTQDAIDEGQKALKTLIINHPQVGWTRAKYSASNDNVILPKPIDMSLDKPDSLFAPIATPSVYTPSGVSTPAIGGLNVDASGQSAGSAPAELSAIAPDVSILVNFSAHAYQDGNLQDIMAAHTFTWGEIIDLLKPLNAPFSSDMMQRRLSESLKPAALAEASKTMPNVHAVSRCQINAVDFQWIKKQLVDNKWLLPARDNRSTREFWTINPSIQR